MDSDFSAGFRAYVQTEIGLLESHYPERAILYLKAVHLLGCNHWYDLYVHIFQREHIYISSRVCLKATQYSGYLHSSVAAFSFPSSTPLPIATAGPRPRYKSGFHSSKELPRHPLPTTQASKITQSALKSQKEHVTRNTCGYQLLQQSNSSTAIQPWWAAMDTQQEHRTTGGGRADVSHHLHMNTHAHSTHAPTGSFLHPSQRCQDQKERSLWSTPLKLPVVKAWADDQVKEWYLEMLWMTFCI